VAGRRKDRRDHQAQEVAGLKDGLRSQNSQQRLQKAESAANANCNRSEKQERDKRQQNPQSEHYTGDESHYGEHNGSIFHSDVPVPCDMRKEAFPTAPTRNCGSKSYCFDYSDYLRIRSLNPAHPCGSQRESRFR
jgi:hypothetical protein